jgi:hypothetical protein
MNNEEEIVRDRERQKERNRKKGRDLEVKR